MVDLQLIAENVIAGRIDAKAVYPPDKKGKPGVRELVKQALEESIKPKDILEVGLIGGMNVVGARFKKNECFVPEVLIAARAMKAGMEQLRPALVEGGIEPCGTFVIGTVKGDLHDIGKNLVGMMLEGAGFEVIDLGVDISPDQFTNAVKEHPKALVGMSALLTTTMPAMKETIASLKQTYGNSRTIIGGAPITKAYAIEIGADGYAPDAATAVDVAKELLGIN